MEILSRRSFLYRVASLSFLYPLSIATASSNENKLTKNEKFPVTVTVLKTAYEAERVAYENYIRYSRKAVEEKYLNIAYLFTAFAFSERIHAENYKRILASMRAMTIEPELDILILDTKANLIKATEGELKKIKKTYPVFLAKLKKESHDQAVINCMYSWKSHQQHQRKISEIRKYSKYFFGQVAKKLEEFKFDFHVCEICGSTIDEAPKSPCDICNHPNLHYRKVIRPA
jgi:rubrerythrin